MHWVKPDVLEVKTDGTQYKFIRGEAFRDDERVIDDVTAKDQASSECVNDVHCLSEWDEQIDKPSHHCGINVGSKRGRLSKSTTYSKR